MYVTSPNNSYVCHFLYIDTDIYRFIINFFLYMYNIFQNIDFTLTEVIRHEVLVVLHGVCGVRVALLETRILVIHHVAYVPLVRNFD